MRWTSLLPAAVVLGATWTLAVPVAGAAPTAPELMALPGACAAPRPMGLQASFPMEMHGGPPPGALGPMEAPLPPYLHDVTLSDEQQDKIFDLLHAQAPQVRQLARTVRKSHAQLRELGFSDKYDDTAARGLIDAGAHAQSELELLRIHSDHEILALLSAEQRKQVAADVAAHERGGSDHDPRGPAPSCWH
jgi:Spy/CpxP family protein refolding chaperone